jgi:hypothetical protein
LIDSIRHIRLFHASTGIILDTQDNLKTKETEMSRIAYDTGPYSGRHSFHFTTAGFVAAIVGKWREHRMMRDIESLPYSVMKDIGFRATEQTNAK